MLLFLGWPGVLGAQETPIVAPAVQEHVLANGLTLLVLPRPGAPIVSFVVEYPIGSVNEAPGLTGISHLLEHLLFKGTTTVGTRDYGAEAPLLRELDRLNDSLVQARNRPTPDPSRVRELEQRMAEAREAASALVRSNELDDIFTRNGARNLNAMTTVESTTYFVELPANRAELWFVLEADLMRNPVFREFYTERDVVMEERRTRLENNPPGLLYEAYLSTAFWAHPYHTPVVGYESDLQELSRPEVEAYFREYYGPNNAVVAIVGDVDPDQILRWGRQYLEPIPRGENPPPVRIREPPQRGERRVDVVFDAEPSLRVGWKVPSQLDADAPALDMLASILTGGRNSRLYRRLVLEERLASGVASTLGPGQLYPGLFSIEAMPIAPHTTREIEAAIYEELDSLKVAPPDIMELEGVRNQLEASNVRRLRSNFGLALQIAGSASLFGDWRTTFFSSRRLQAVTPEDIQRVVARYFLKETRTVATLVPPQGYEGGNR